jgi:Predicted membrane protein (DUF2178).
MKKKVMYGMQAVFGAGLILAGNFIFVTDSVKLLSGFCIGFGAAMLALGIGSFIQACVVSKEKDEALRKWKEVQVNDERNVRIREKAGYMTAKIMNYAICVFILTLAYMKADIIYVVMAASLIALEFVLAVVFSDYYSKKM